MCGSTRANFWLRAVAPEHTGDFADRHDAKVWRCLCEILGVPVDHDEAQVIATLSFSEGELGLSSAFRSRSAAHWASWADCMRMVRQRHPDVAEFMMTNLADGASPCFVSVRGCQQSLGEAGLEMPSWAELSESPLVLEENSEPNQPNVGWQRKAVHQVEQKFIHEEGSTTRFC